MSEGRDFTKEEALRLLDSTIMEMQQSLSQKDDFDIFPCDLGAEINLMNDLYKKLCQLFYCKPYGTDLSGFIQDLQCRMRLPFLHMKERYACFRIYKRQWEIEILNDSLHITYSDNLEVDGVTLEHGESFSVDALIILDILKVEIIQSFKEVLPLLKAEEQKRKGIIEDDESFEQDPQVFELTSIVMLDKTFPSRECKRISHGLFKTQEDAEKALLDDWLGVEEDTICHFIHRREIGTDAEFYEPYLHSFFADKKDYINSIPSQDIFSGRDVNTIRFKKGDIVWCVDPEGRDKMTLGIIFSQPPSDLWYQQRLKELRKKFGNDYSFEMDVNDDSYVVYIPKKESTTPYDSWFCCSSSCVFPVTEKVPDDIKSKLLKVLEYNDSIPWREYKMDASNI